MTILFMVPPKFWVRVTIYPYFHNTLCRSQIPGRNGLIVYVGSFDPLTKRGKDSLVNSPICINIGGVIVSQREIRGC